MEGASRVRVVSIRRRCCVYRRESRAVAVESFRKIGPHKKSLGVLFIFRIFFRFFFLGRTQPVVLCTQKSVRLFRVFLLFLFLVRTAALRLFPIRFRF